MKIENHNTVIFLGDSVTDSGRHHPDRGEGYIGGPAYGSGYVHQFVSLFRVLHPDWTVRFLNKGVGGEQSRHVLARLKDDVLSYHPDIVTLCIGINDVWRSYDVPQIPDAAVGLEDYRNNVKQIVEGLLSETKQIVLMTPYMVDDNPVSPMRLQMIEYGKVCKELGAEYGLPVIDLQEMFEALMAKGIPSYELSGDRIHPSAAGHMAIMLKLMEVFGEKIG